MVSALKGRRKTGKSAALPEATLKAHGSVLFIQAFPLPLTPSGQVRVNFCILTCHFDF